MTKLKLHWQILIAMVIGIGIGLYFQGTDYNSNKFYGLISSFGTIFVRLLKMIIVPLVSASLIMGIVSLGNIQNLGKIGFRALAYYLLTSFFCLSLSKCLSNFSIFVSASNRLAFILLLVFKLTFIFSMVWLRRLNAC